MICSAVLMTNFLLMMVFHLVVIGVLHTPLSNVIANALFNSLCGFGVDIETDSRRTINWPIPTWIDDIATRMSHWITPTITGQNHGTFFNSTMNAQSLLQMERCDVTPCILFTRPIFDNKSYDKGENVQKLPLVAIRKKKCTLAIGQWCAAAIVRSDGRSTIVIDHPSSVPPFSMA